MPVKEITLAYAKLRVPGNYSEKSYKAGYLQACKDIDTLTKRVLREKFGYPESIEWADVNALWRELVGEHEL